VDQHIRFSLLSIFSPASVNVLCIFGVCFILSQVCILSNLISQRQYYSCFTFKPLGAFPPRPRLPIVLLAYACSWSCGYWL
jgi:hypothetical protein